MIAAHVTTFGYLIVTVTVGAPMLAPLVYWIAKGCPHVDD